MNEVVERPLARVCIAPSATPKDTAADEVRAVDVAEIELTPRLQKA